MVAHRVSYLAGELSGYKAAAVITGTPYVPELFDLFLHNWLDSVTIESTYSTDVTAALTLTEEMVNLNPRPQRSVTARFDAIRQRDCARVLALLTRLGSQPLPFPLFSEWSKLTASTLNDIDTAPFGQTSKIPCDTANRRFHIGAQVAVFSFDTEHRPTDIEIQTIVSVHFGYLIVTRLTHTHHANARVVPLIFGEVTLETSGSLSTDESLSATVTVTEKAGDTQLPTLLGYGDNPDVNTYQQIPIFQARHNWETDPTFTASRVGGFQQEGRAPFVDLLGSRTIMTLSYAGLSLNRASAFELLKFIDSRNGRLRPFWVINPTAVFTVVSLTTAYLEIARTLTVDDCMRSFNHVGFKYLDDSTEVRHVWRIEDTGTSLKLYFEESMPLLRIDLNSIRSVSSAYLMRLKSDSYTENWISNAIMSISLEFVETVELQDVPRVLFSDAFASDLTLIKDIFGYWIPAPSTLFKPNLMNVSALDDQVFRWVDSVYGRQLEAPGLAYHTWYPAQASVRAANGGAALVLSTQDSPASNALGLTLLIAVKRTASHSSSANDYLIRFPNSSDSAADAFELTFTSAMLREGSEYLETAISLSVPDLSYARDSVHIIAAIWIPGGTLKVYRDGVLVGFAPVSIYDLPSTLPYAMRVMNWGNPLLDTTSVDDAQVYRIAMFSRALNKHELNAAGGAIAAAVAGSTWARVV